MSSLRRFTAVLMLIVSSSLFAQSQINYYSGTIGTYSVEMNLQFDSSVTNVSGFYRYIGKASWLGLKGTVNTGKTCRIEEFPMQQNEPSGTSTGTFEGSFNASGAFTGQWKNTDGKKSFPFSLVKNCGTNGLCFQLGTHSATVHNGDQSASSEINYMSVSGGNAALKTMLDTFIFNRLFYDEMYGDSLGKSFVPLFPQYDTIADRYVRMNASNEWSMDWNAGSELVWNGSGVLCIDNYNWEHSGGAHGVGFSGYNCFNLETGKLITEDDIFLDGYEEPLRLKAIEHLDAEGLFIERDSLQLNGNFFITPEGIGYFYNSYEISCYACGTPGTFIPWKELDKWIDPNGPMGWVK